MYNHLASGRAIYRVLVKLPRHGYRDLVALAASFHERMSLRRPKCARTLYALLRIAVNLLLSELPFSVNEITIFSSISANLSHPIKIVKRWVIEGRTRVTCCMPYYSLNGVLCPLASIVVRIWVRLDPSVVQSLRLDNLLKRNS